MPDLAPGALRRSAVFDNRLFLAFAAVIGLRWAIDIGLPLLNYDPMLSDPTTGPRAAGNPAGWALLSTLFFATCLAGAWCGLQSRSRTPERADRARLEPVFHRALRLLTLVAAVALAARMLLILSTGISLDALARRAVFTDEALYTNPFINLLGIIGEWATPLAVAMLLTGTRYRWTAMGTIVLIVLSGVLTGGRGSALIPLVMWALLSFTSGNLTPGRRMRVLAVTAGVASLALLQIGATRYSTGFVGVVTRTLFRPKRIDDMAFAADLRGSGFDIHLGEAIVGSVTSGLPVGLLEGNRSVLAQVADHLPTLAIRTAGNSGTTFSGGGEGYLLGGLAGVLILGFVVGLVLGGIGGAANRLPRPAQAFVLVSVLMLLFTATGSRTTATLGLITLSVLVPLGLYRMVVAELVNERGGRFANLFVVGAVTLGLGLFTLVNSKLGVSGSLEILAKALVAAAAMVPVLSAVGWLVRGTVVPPSSVPQLDELGHR